MKISDLSAATDVPVATLKYYLREGLLPPGEPLTRTSADYGDAHVERVRLIRALTSVGGLSVATTARVLEVIEEPSTDRVDVMGAAQRALLGEDFVVVPEGDGVVGDGSDEGGFPPSRARAWLTDQGWQVDPRDPVVDDLDAAWAACDDAGLGLDESRTVSYTHLTLPTKRIV